MKCKAPTSGPQTINSLEDLPHEVLEMIPLATEDWARVAFAQRKWRDLAQGMTRSVQPLLATLRKPATAAAWYRARRLVKDSNLEVNAPALLATAMSCDPGCTFAATALGRMTHQNHRLQQIALHAAQAGPRWAAMLALTWQPEDVPISFLEKCVSFNEGELASLALQQLQVQYIRHPGDGQLSNILRRLVERSKRTDIGTEKETWVLSNKISPEQLPALQRAAEGGSAVGFWALTMLQSALPRTPGVGAAIRSAAERQQRWTYVPQERLAEIVMHEANGERAFYAYESRAVTNDAWEALLLRAASPCVRARAFQSLVHRPECLTPASATQVGRLLLQSKQNMAGWEYSRFVSHLEQIGDIVATMLRFPLDDEARSIVYDLGKYLLRLQRGGRYIDPQVCRTLQEIIATMPYRPDLAPLLEKLAVEEPLTTRGMDGGDSAADVLLEFFSRHPTEPSLLASLQRLAQLDLRYSSIKIRSALLQATPKLLAMQAGINDIPALQRVACRDASDPGILPDLGSAAVERLGFLASHENTAALQAIVHVALRAQSNRLRYLAANQCPSTVEAVPRLLMLVQQSDTLGCLAAGKLRSIFQAYPADPAPLAALLSIAMDPAIDGWARDLAQKALVDSRTKEAHALFAQLACEARFANPNSFCLHARALAVLLDLQKAEPKDEAVRASLRRVANDGTDEAAAAARRQLDPFWLRAWQDLSKLCGRCIGSFARTLRWRPAPIETDR